MTHYPIPDAALDGRLGIVGLTGSGKTNAAKGGVERLLDQCKRVCVVDFLDGWWGLRLSANGKRPAFPVAIFGGRHGDLPINEHAGAIIGQAVAKATQSTIVSLSELDSDAARRRFARDFFDALHKHNRSPLYLIVDEADFYAPQNPVKDGPGPMLLNRIKEIAARGRMRGFRTWVVTQRPAKLHKDVLSQCDTLVAMQLTASQDRRAIEGWIGDQADAKTGADILATLPRMKRGQGVVWSPRLGILKPEQFPLSATYDSGRTPEFGEEGESVSLGQLDLGMLQEQLATVVSEAKANDPAELKREVTRLQRELGAKDNSASATDLASAEQRGYARGKIDGYADALKLAEPFLPKLRQIAAIGTDLAQGIEQWSQRKPQPVASYRPVASAKPPSPRVVNGAGDSEVGTGGLRRILIALAQCPDGLSARQIGVRAGLSSSSGTFSTYLSTARKNGWAEGERANIRITQDGLRALGSYEPLPTGQALLDYWLNELGDSGAARLLRAVAEAYPRAISKEQAGDAASLSASSGTFSTYLSKLRTLELIEGRGELKASADLFG